MFDDSELVLILAPSENDMQVAVDVLADSSMTAKGCASVEVLCDHLGRGCGVVVIAHEALIGPDVSLLQECLKGQPPWSDLPIVLLTAKNFDGDRRAIFSSGNISFLERPFGRVTLVSAVEVALRARRKQYKSRQLIEEQAQAALRRDEFFATLSHELRTPLNVILGWTEMLKADDLTREERLDALDILDRNARVQKSLIDDLLDTSRIITGKLYLDRVPVSLLKLLKGLHKEYEPRAIEKGLLLTLELPKAEAVVLADEPRLSQIISNLLINAIKFTPRGGSIAIMVLNRNSRYEIHVRDTGQGMDAAFLPFVFDRLKQEDMSITRVHGGLGLGLAIAAHLVEQHEGTIEAKSEGRGRGSEFIVSLPVVREAAVLHSAQVTDQKQKISLEGLRILVVDDSPDIRQLIDLWLKKAHATVHLAASAREALEQLAVFAPDILLSDIGMPEMDGYELIRAVRERAGGKFRSLPAAALTAYAKDEERARALQAGFQTHISKPISNEQLVGAVATLANR